MEKNELSRIPDPDAVVSPDDPNDPANMRSTCALETNNLKEIRAVQDKVERGNNNNLESSSSKHEKHQPNDTKIEIKQLEEILGASLKNIHEPMEQCCIYKVPRDLRNIDTRAYTPQVISIGPFHHGKSWLSKMENQKLIYVSEFSKREGVEKLKEFKRFIEEKEQIIRKYYQQNSSLESTEFVNMILRDAVFIIELFLKNAKKKVQPVKKRKFDFALDTKYVKAAIIRDLQLLENQLPYFLLKNLFGKGDFHNFSKKDYPDRGGPFLSLSYLFFFDHFPKPNNEIRQYKIQHFTDLRRNFLLMNFLPQERKQGKHVRDLPTATKLHGWGVQFIGIDKFEKRKEGGSSRVKFEEIEDGSSLKISCQLVRRAIGIPWFKSCQTYFTACNLRIPCLEIDDWSESLYRNMMALELCHYPDDTHICNFILLMNFLINTDKDVDLLVDQKIIVSRMGDHATVAKMFNNLSIQITPSDSVYHDIYEKLKEQYDRSWNHTLKTLISEYFGDIWKGYATVAAIILLVLTFVQTVYSVL